MERGDCLDLSEPALPARQLPDGIVVELLCALVGMWIFRVDETVGDAKSSIMEGRKRTDGIGHGPVNRKRKVSCLLFRQGITLTQGGPE